VLAPYCGRFGHLLFPPACPGRYSRRTCFHLFCPLPFECFEASRPPLPGPVALCGRTRGTGPPSSGGPGLRFFLFSLVFSRKVVSLGAFFTDVPALDGVFDRGANPGFFVLSLPFWGPAGGPAISLFFFPLFSTSVSSLPHQTSCFFSFIFLGKNHLFPPLPPFRWSPPLCALPFQCRALVLQVYPPPP